MGTSATVRFKYKGNDQILVNVRHHNDGYIDGVGHDLANFLLSKKIVNGITVFDDGDSIANGFDCLVAQYISNVKKGPGDVYIYPQHFKENYNYDVIYDVYKNEIYIKVTHFDEVLFEGSPKELLEYKEQDKKEDNMSNEEHYFENLIYHGSDEVASNCNKDNIKPEVRQTIEICYYYVIYNIFHTKEKLAEYLEENKL